MYGITVVVIVLLSANVLRSTWNYGNKNMFFGGLATFLSAFILWNIGEHKCQLCYIPFSNRILFKTVTFVMIWKTFVINPPWLSSNLSANCTAGGTFSQVAINLPFSGKLYYYCSLQDMLHTWKFSSVYTTDLNIWDRSLYILSTVWG